MVIRRLVVFLFFAVSGSAGADGWDPTSKASNRFSINNTRHNLTVSFNPLQRIMNIARNDYLEVCVYCHTPHGASKRVDAPLWNRTINVDPYLTYDKPRTLDRPIGQPGPNSLTCLSCHDGSISIDSIINMPGSGLYNKAQETTVNFTFLDAWPGEGFDGRHFVLGPGFSQPGRCTICHNSNSPTMPDYEGFVIGTDLSNDHPVGVQYPVTFEANVDFNAPIAAVSGRMSYFDENLNSFADTREVRLYDTGDGPEVECASCHDPHGVRSGSDGSTFSPSFLRVNNGVADNGTSGTAGIVSHGASALCLTCHIK